MNYQSLITRNNGYITSELQEKIKETIILVAGCGIGSTVAESAVRLGFTKFVLVDKDLVEVHNLNRQIYVSEDIGRPKVEALAKRMKAINPIVSIKIIHDWINYENAKEIVNSVDVIFDTIDFLSVHGIVALHDECHRQQKPVISALSIGWGAGAIIFKNKDDWDFRKVFGIPRGELPADVSYVEYFKKTFLKISEHLNPKVVEALGKVFHLMENGKPCPASQIVPGANSVSVIAMYSVVKLLNSEEITLAPYLNIIDPIMQIKTISLY